MDVQWNWKGLANCQISSLVKFFFQFTSDINGGKIQKIVLEEEDYQPEFYNNRKDPYNKYALKKFFRLSRARTEYLPPRNYITHKYWSAVDIVPKSPKKSTFFVCRTDQENIVFCAVFFDAASDLVCVYYHQIF